MLANIIIGGIFVLVTNAALVELNWNITYTTANPDGLYERRVIGVNGQWPPPPIDVTINDTLKINVHNALDKPTALHAHGMFQNGTAYMDGPTMVTQCPIPPGYDFTYEFNITQYGTFWIHTTPDSGLINDNANSTFDFVPGKTYRLRLINMSGFSEFFFSIDGHNMDVIEVDGVDVQRSTVNSVTLTAAQRVSVLVTANNDTSLNYNMHADMNTDMFDKVPPELQPNITAPIYYDRSHNNFAPIQDLGMSGTFDDTTLKPLQVEDAVNPDQELTLSIKFEVTTDGINRGMFGDLPFLLPKVPSINTLLSQGNYSSDPAVYGPQGVATVFNHLSMVQVVLNNEDQNDHPFHLHGNVFQVVGRGNGTYDSSIQLNTTNPMRRDTISVPGQGFTVIRFRADNPGVWFFHCHIEWHLESGLAALFVVAPDVAQQRMSLPQSMKDLCQASGIPATGNAAGKEGLDLSGAPSGITLIPDEFTPRGIGAMAGCIIAALLGIGTIIWFAHADPQKEARLIAERMRSIPQ
ncbi:iron transport multicopper oxidase fio1 [Lichtheimia corymbifera JMRC:FSU:9682]|uniref:Iron transport multicopper oxidase fio1 n=1 Tax=Lichtheimia corymbifera JMRC:FSU:9682 TaxID=1263082 RepID=A0A068RSQ7_9FUNG|nr:iron transport multicopper oxidase fio1 [Lichtheimia corymbifera JMRC:FSU:9682]